MRRVHEPKSALTYASGSRCCHEIGSADVKSGHRIDAGPDPNNMSGSVRSSV
jgi:hypothetical protein